MTILLCDDHPLFCQAVMAILERERLIEVVGKVGNGKEAIQFVEQLKPDIVLMDLEMPVVDGFEATRRIKAAHPDIRILIMTFRNDEEAVLQSLIAGASGYIVKGFRPAELVNAIKTVGAGEQYLSVQAATV